MDGWLWEIVNVEMASEKSDVWQRVRVILPNFACIDCIHNRVISCWATLRRTINRAVKARALSAAKWEEGGGGTCSRYEFLRKVAFPFRSGRKWRSVGMSGSLEEPTKVIPQKHAWH